MIVPWEADLALVLKGVERTVKSYRPHEQPRSGRFVALYGRAGTGKTTLLAQLAKCVHTRPVLYLDIKGGTWVLADDADITIIPIQDYLEFSTVTNNLFRMESLAFKSIVIDHGTELQALNLLSLMKLQPGRLSGSGFPTQAQYGLSTAQMLNVIRGYKNLCERLGVHVVMSVQEDARTENVTNQIIKSGVGFTPSLARAFPSMVDIVGHLTVTNDPPNYTRVLNFATTAHSDAKFRQKEGDAQHRVPATIAFRDQPVLGDLFNTIVGGEPWPDAKYKALASKARVEYATVTAEPSSVVDAAVATHTTNDTNNEKDTD